MGAARRVGDVRVTEGGPRPLISAMVVVVREVARVVDETPKDRGGSLYFAVQRWLLGSFESREILVDAVDHLPDLERISLV